MLSMLIMFAAESIVPSKSEEMLSRASAAHVCDGGVQPSGRSSLAPAR